MKITVYSIVRLHAYINNEYERNRIHLYTVGKAFDG